MTRLWTAALVLLALACAGASLEAGLSAQRRGGDPKAAAMKNPVAADAASLTAGRQLYLKNCRHCHGTKGLGDGPLAPTDIRPANLIDATWDHGSSDGEIFAVIANGAGPDSQMKGVSGLLTDVQIWNIVNYLRGLGPPRR